MLTKNDLSQIRNVVHEEVDVTVEGKLESKLKPIRKELSQVGQVIDERLKPIKKDLSEIGQVIDEKLDSKLRPIKRNLRYLKKTVDIIVKNYDEADVKLQRRVRRIEDHIGLTP